MDHRVANMPSTDKGSNKNGDQMEGVGARLSKVMTQYGISNVELLNALRKRGMLVSGGRPLKAKQTISDWRNSEDLPKKYLVPIARCLREDFDATGVTWQYLAIGEQALQRRTHDPDLMLKIINGIKQVCDEEGLSIKDKKLALLYVSLLSYFERMGGFDTDHLREQVRLASNE